MPRIAHALLIVACGVWLAGCGGGKEPQAKPAEPKGQMVARQVPEARDRPREGTAKLRPRQSPEDAAKAEPEKPVEPEAPPIDPSTDPDDIFEVAGNALQFDVSDAPAVREADLFTVLTVPSGGASLFAPEIPARDAAAAPPAATVPLPAGFTAIAAYGAAESGLPWRIRCELDQSEMALVPAGTFPLGHNGGPAESSPQLTVYVDNFYIDVTEVTLAQHELFRRAMREERKRTMQEPLNVASPPDHPALGVPWSEVNFYANWCGKGLPNEAEWEKAARSDKGFEYPWGSGGAVWARHRAVDQIDPVKSFRTDRSVYGVYDLAGNAREWCDDYFSPTTYRDTAAVDGVVKSWKGTRRASNENIRVVRGGGAHWESWHRQGMNARERDPKVGFRCVLRIDGRQLERTTPGGTAGSPSAERGARQ